MAATFGIAVDIGGTFTDVVLRSSEGAVLADKALTTHGDLLEGALTAVRQVLGKAGIGSTAVSDLFVHATTIVTNALIERSGPRTALLVTQGFRDVLIIRNEHRYDMFDLQIEFPAPLVPRDLTFEIEERMLASGTEHQPLDKAKALNAIGGLRRMGARSVAICLLNSYRNGLHERQLAQLVKEELTDVFLSLSCEVSPQIREYPRASTTAINAYTMPIVKPYLARLANAVAAEGFPNKPLIMLSNGGFVGIDTAAQNPVRMMESGPAAGALAASHFAHRLGYSRLMSFDMGGTTAKACLIEDEKPLIASQFEVDRRYRFKPGSGLPVAVPCIDMIEVGAGGGSIAHVDALGLLKVGPQSAGSEPGPACYGRGGTQPTVTDADVVLGLIDPARFLGGDMVLDAGAAHRSISAVASQLKLGEHETAAGIYRLVCEVMAAVTRAHATDRGVDHRGMPLFAFGGAGPVHACRVAELLQATTVVFPPYASVLSAFGALVTPPRLDVVRGFLSPLDSIGWEGASALLSEMIAQAGSALRDAGCTEKDIKFTFGADLRYLGQQNELTVWLAHDPRAQSSAQPMLQAFEESYRAHYSVVLPGSPVEIVSWRVTAEGPLNAIRSVPDLPSKTAPSPGGRRSVHLWSDHRSVPVWDRSLLGLDARLVGPALIEERETTIVLSPGWHASVDQTGSLIATREDSR